MKNKLLAYMGGLGALVIGAILLSIRQQLIAFGPWVIGVLLAMIGLVTVYYLHKLYVQFRLNHLKLKSHMMEISQREQDLLDQETRRQLAIGQFALNSHVTRTRIYPDAKGFMPVLAGDDMRTLPGQIDLLMLPQFNRTNNRVQISEEADSLHEPTEVKAIPYETIKHLIPPGRSCLGINPINNQVETCDFSALMTMWICGGSSTGKTNTVSLKINEAIENGQNVRLIVIDPHKEKDDSLYNKIKRYESRFLFSVASTSSEIYNALDWFKQEFERRLEAGNEGHDDILLIVDEVSRVARTDETKALVKEIAEIAGTESRGFGMFGWFISQRAAGLSWLRNVVITVIAHKMNMMSERKLAANEDPVVARSMDNWPRGRVVVYGAEFEPKVLQMPLFTPPQIVDGTSETMETLQPKKALSDAPIFQADSLFMAARSNGVFHQSSQTAPDTRFHAKYIDDSSYQNGAFSADSGAKNETERKVLVFPENGASGLTVRSDLQSEEGLNQVKEYRFTETEIVQFVALYKAIGNIEKVLSQMKKGSGYKPHARELIQAHGLRKDA